MHIRAYTVSNLNTFPNLLSRLPTKIFRQQGRFVHEIHNSLYSLSLPNSVTFVGFTVL